MPLARRLSSESVLFDAAAIVGPMSKVRHPERDAPSVSASAHADAVLELGRREP
jgi:hypothetical protein